MEISFTFQIFDFYVQYLFNQDVSNWDVSKSSDFSAAFSGASLFNQDISSWNVKKGIYFNDMFRNAASFNQDLSSWCISAYYYNADGFSYGTAGTWTLPRFNPEKRCPGDSY